MENHYNCQEPITTNRLLISSFRYRLGLCIKKNTENVTLTRRRRQKSHGNLTFNKKITFKKKTQHFCFEFKLQPLLRGLILIFRLGSTSLLWEPSPRPPPGWFTFFENSMAYSILQVGEHSTPVLIMHGNFEWRLTTTTIITLQQFIVPLLTKKD